MMNPSFWDLQDALLPPEPVEAVYDYECPRTPDRAWDADAGTFSVER